ncbi:MAG: DUF3109 family protein [Clostridiales bacterium]|nr:DUF3109 family protein [Clostridiales bacterium]
MNKETTETVMLEIKDTLVSLDLAEQYFCCDIEQCKGECCIEGDAGAPVTEAEAQEIEKRLPLIWDDMSPAARREVEENGVSYIDVEGERVTTIVNGRDCAFSCYAPGGVCICALDKAFREGRSTWRKPISCYLYPVRIDEYPGFTAVNYHRWKICRSAEINGRRLGIRAYQFLKEPLTERFGKEWYDELKLACEAYLEQYGDSPSDTQ